MNFISRRLVYALTAVTLSSSMLSACAPVLIGGAVAGGTMTATDRRTLGTQLEDKNIELKVSGRINERFSDQAHVNVNSFNRQVLLTGEVDNTSAQTEIVRITRGVENVKSIVNEVAVTTKSSLGQRTYDSYITGKIRTALISQDELASNAIHITTEAGEVFLMGIVTPREADLAANAAAKVSGVKKVVKLFEIISEEELALIMRNTAQTKTTPQQ